MYAVKDSLCQKLADEVSYLVLEKLSELTSQCTAEYARCTCKVLTYIVTSTLQKAVAGLGDPVEQDNLQLSE